MSRVCDFCGKKTSFGKQYARRGLAKAKGGVGRKITGKTRRKFQANLQNVRAVINGGVQRVRSCTQCIRAGKVQKPVKTAYQSPEKDKTTKTTKKAKTAGTS
ncbi:MAG: 50S ribosomal protein L28 [Planctomycetota bacterium]